MAGSAIRGFHRATQFVLDVLFPISCVGCRKEKHPPAWLCDSCFSQIKRLHHIIENDKHTDFRALSRVLIAADYSDEIMESAIHHLKYNFVQHLAMDCAQLCIEAIHAQQQRLLLPQEPQDIAVVPVPLHRVRMNERGFNQSELIARGIAQEFRWELKTRSLIRKRYTTPQMLLNRTERLNNLTDAFTYIGTTLSGKTILLIDDVVTTSTTLEECARPLRAAGATCVIGIAVAGQK